MFCLQTETKNFVGNYKIINGWNAKFLEFISIT